MARHPQLSIPDIGPRDHAWDLLGEWRATLALPDQLVPLPAALIFPTWDGGQLRLDAAITDAAPVPLHRVGPITHVDAGGGALAFTLEAGRFGRLRATLWPGELQLNGEPLPDGTVLLTATARRSLAYYRAKYPQAPD